jgi:hypothetical protein
MEFVRYRLPSILINVCAVITILGLAGAIFLPWYYTTDTDNQSHQPNPTLSNDTQQLGIRWRRSLWMTKANQEHAQ